MPLIYQPAEDSYLLQESLISFLDGKKKSISILDMGSGSGIQAKTCKKFKFKNILCADINPEAVSNLKGEGFKAIKSNLFSKVDKKFDLIIFNPPYLPEDKREPKDSQLNTTAGKKGYEIIVKFLKGARSHLNPGGKILLLFSSLSKPKVVKSEAKKIGYSFKELTKMSLSFEKLFVYEFSFV